MKIIKNVIFIMIFCLTCIMMSSTMVQATTLEITTETLNLREETSTESDIIAQMSAEETCELIEESGEWYKVKYGTYTGYVKKEFVKVQGKSDTKVKDEDNSDNDNKSDDNSNDNNSDNNNDNNNNNEEKPATQKPDEEKPKTTEPTNTNSQIDVRIAPLINSSIIAKINKGENITKITQINGWTYIQTDTISGWIREDSKATGKTTTKKVVKSEQENNTTDTKKEDENKNQNEAEDTKKVEENKTETSEKSFTEKTMYINDSYVNLRKEANTSSEIIMVVAQNTKLTVIGESGDWYKVKTSNGDAFVLKKLLSDSQTSATSRNADVGSRNEEKNEEGKSQPIAKSNSGKGEQVISYAKKYLGIPYVYGGASTSGFDCSGFTMYVYKKFGVSLSHNAVTQAKVGKEVKVDKTSSSSIKNNLQAGDLVFFLDYKTMDGIGHCGIYIGDGNFIHASSGSGYCVKISNLLPGESYNARFCAARRVI